MVVAKNRLLRVFWPSDAPRSKEEGAIIGWRNSPLDIFVVSILEDVETRKVESALQAGTLYRDSPHPIRRLFHLCGYASMHVLGTINPRTPSTTFDPDRLEAYVDPSSPFPSIFCPEESKTAIQIVKFDRPSSHYMQYLSLTPIPLVLGDKPPKAHSRSEMTAPVDLDEQREQAERVKLLQKLKLHTVIKHPPTQKEVMLPIILTQINCSAELSKLVAKNLFAIRPRLKRSSSVGEKVVESATNFKDLFLSYAWQVLSDQIFPFIMRMFIFGLIGHRFIAEIVLKVLEWRPSPESAALKDISATAQQVDIRLQQFCYWPIQYLTLQKRRDDWESVTDKHPDYIRFFNSLWLVANDVIIGIALGSYIIDNAHWVSWQISAILNEWTVDGLRDTIYWLMDWPAGLKLNTDLAIFLGDLFIWVTDYWRGEKSNASWRVQMLTQAGCLHSLQPLLPHLIYFIGFASFAGATMPISMFSDLLSLLTVHIYCFYTASARIFHWQLTIIMSLFHLFRGKKYNVLRNRIDSCDYDLDQLLLGTILFTLLFFLLPTVAVFYLAFTTARMAIISLLATLDTLLAFLNHFPLFALMLRIKDAQRLPGQSQKTGIILSQD